MATAKETIQQRADLVAKGYAWNYLKEWPPRVDMWRHKNWMNMEGEVVMPAGTKVPNQPGNPDSQVRLSNRGLRPWPPNDDCSCIWCQRQAAGKFDPPKSSTEESDATPTPEEVSSTPLPEEGASQDHRHIYKTNRLGSPCSREGCTTKRLAAFKPRKKAA